MYWILYSCGKYVKDFDHEGKPYHMTSDKKEAYRFYSFNAAMAYFNRGFAILKEYEN